MKPSEQNPVRHFTTSACIVDGDKVLLVHHKKSKLWLPVGGHIEENETPIQAVKREVKEESGLDVEIVGLTDYKTYPTAEILPAPYGISLHSVGDHQHMDMRYIGRIKGSKNLNGTEECRWFTLEQIRSLDDCPDEIKDFVKYAIQIVKKLRQ